MTWLYVSVLAIATRSLHRCIVMNFVAICSSCLPGRPAAIAFCMFSIVEAVMYEHVVGIRVVSQEVRNAC